MKKVTMTFYVSDEIADKVLNKMQRGEMGEAAELCNAECTDKKYDVVTYGTNEKDLVVIDKSVYSKQDALNEMKAGMACCEGSERERYAFAFSSIEEGYNYIDTYKEKALRYQHILYFPVWRAETKDSDKIDIWAIEKGNDHLFDVFEEDYIEMVEAGYVDDGQIDKTLHDSLIEELREKYGILWADTL